MGPCCAAHCSQGDKKESGHLQKLILKLSGPRGLLSLLHVGMQAVRVITSVGKNTVCNQSG